MTGSNVVQLPASRPSIGDALRAAARALEQAAVAADQGDLDQARAFFDVATPHAASAALRLGWVAAPRKVP